MNFIEEIRKSPKDLKLISDNLGKIIPILQDEDERKEIVEKGGLQDLIKLVCLKLKLISIGIT